MSKHLRNVCMFVSLVLLMSITSLAVDITISTGGKTTAVETAQINVAIGETGTAVFTSEDVQYLSKSGEPKLPWKAMRVLLAPNADTATVSCSIVSAEYETVEGVWNVAPMPPMAAIHENRSEEFFWPEGKTIVDGRDVDIYENEALWPTDRAKLTSTGKLRRWCIAELAVPLVRYNPVSGEMQKLISCELKVDYQQKAVRLNKSENDRVAVDRIRKLTANYDQAADEYDIAALSLNEYDSPVIRSQAAIVDGDVVAASPAGSNGYVIISTNDIRANSTKLAAFVAHKESMGYTVTVIDEDDTGTTVVGDPAATKLRQWLQANYVSMDIKYVLIIGNPTPTEGYVPMKTYPRGEQGIPTDYFYAELTCDWDKDGDGIIGEMGDDATNGDEIERYFEVYVGRIPYYGVIADTDAILQKTINYENSTDTQWRRNALISAKPMNEKSDRHYYHWGEQIKADLLEPRAISSDRVYRDGSGHSPSQHDINPPAEYPPEAYPADVWSQGQYGLHVWNTHGNGVVASGIIWSSEASDLNDNYPSTVFQGACSNAEPDNPDNLAYSILKNGGIGVVGATDTSYLWPETDFSDSPGYPGMSFSYSRGIVEGKSCGAAIWDLKEEITSWWTSNWTLFNLYGDPSVVIIMPERPAFTVTPTDTFYTKAEYRVGSGASRTYTLENNSGSSLNWTASKTQSWFDISPVSGSIPVGGSAMVDITLNAEATENMSANTHEGIVVFTDTTNDIVEERGVVLAIGPRGLKGYWKLDEMTGSTAYDSTVYANHGLLGEDYAFDANSVTGQFAGGLNFDGVDDYVSVSGVNFERNTATISAWIKTNGIQGSYTGIVSNRLSDAANFNFKDNNHLGYHWNNNNWGWDSGLVVPDNQWVFVALVIKPDRAKIYMYDGTLPIQTAINFAAHSDESFYGSTSIGRDANGSRYFNGAMDDVRIYDYSLNYEEIEALIQGGGAESPSPFDGAGDVLTVTSLQWAMGAAATGNDVYFGTDYNAVLNAGIASPQYYKGRHTEATYQLGGLDKNTEYFWRIDTVNPAGVIIPGPLWHFTTGDGRGAITRQAWTDISGESVSNLTGDSDYPDNPDVTETLTSFEGPSEWDDNYGSRIYGFLVPPETGDYTFWIAGDDNCQLWLSSDSEPTNESMIAQVSGWTDPREWGTGEQQSTQIALTAGHPYYIMALHKEGGGGDHVAVAWQGPGITQQIIAGEYLMPYSDTYNWGPQFTSDPLVKTMAIEGVDYSDTLDGDATALDGGDVTFAKVAGSQWLSIAADGAMSGLPANSNVGLNTFTVRATDIVGGLFDDATIQITVLNTFTGELGLADFAGFAGHWLDSGCPDVPACGGADLTGDGAVGVDDLQRFAWLWLADYGTDGFVGRWTFDTDASDAVGDNDGVLTNGAAVTATDPVVGIGALSLDGIDDYVEMAGYYGIAGTASRTVSAWVKTTAVDGEIVTWGQPGTEGGKWTVRTNSDGTLRAEVHAGWACGTKSITDGQWHHIAAVLVDDGSPDISEVLLYVDGQLDTHAAHIVRAVDTISSAPVRIGICLEQGGDRYFNGTIDDVRIYDRALTPTEIDLVFNHDVFTASSVHVESIVCDTENGTIDRKRLRATITVFDDFGMPVEGATVFGIFTDVFTESQNGVTDASGSVTLTTVGQLSSPAFTFCVDDIIDTLTYAPAENVETCDSY